MCLFSADFKPGAPSTVCGAEGGRVVELLGEAGRSRNGGARSLLVATQYAVPDPECAGCPFVGYVWACNNPA